MSEKFMSLRFCGRDKDGKPVYSSEGKYYVDIDPYGDNEPVIYSRCNNSFNGELEKHIEDTPFFFLPERYRVWKDDNLFFPMFLTFVGVTDYGDAIYLVPDTKEYYIDVATYCETPKIYTARITEHGKLAIDTPLKEGTRFIFEPRRYKDYHRIVSTETESES